MIYKKKKFVNITVMLVKPVFKSHFRGNFTKYNIPSYHAKSKNNTLDVVTSISR